MPSNKSIIIKMTAYDRFAARKKQAKNLLPQFTDSDRSQFRIQPSRLNHAPQPSLPSLRPQLVTPATPANIFRIPATPAQQRLNSVQFAQQDISLHTKQQNKKRKSISFEDFNSLDENPLGKRDGLEVRGEELSLKENINYLLGEGDVRSNDGHWRIIEIGEAVEENVITFSRALLLVWVLLPRWLFRARNLYWLLALIVSFIVSSKKSVGWFLAVYFITMLADIGLRIAQLNGKMTTAKKSDSRTCQKYSVMDKTWITVPQDQLTSGDIIKLQPLDPFPCDSLLLQSSSSRLSTITQSNLHSTHSPSSLKQTILASPRQLPLSGMLYLRSDVSNLHMSQWQGYLKLKQQLFTISYKNFCHRNTVNNDAVELVCVVMYTACNQKVLEQVGYPRVFKERVMEKRMNRVVWGMVVLALVSALVEGLVNYGFAMTVKPTGYLRISASVLTSLRALAKYISEFTIILPIFYQTIYLLFGLLSKHFIQKDPFFSSTVHLHDSQSLHQLSQTTLLISPLPLLFHSRTPSLLSLRVKQLTYSIGQDIDFILPKDIQLFTDFLSAAFLTCQQLEQSGQKIAILNSGRKFGMTRDFESNTVRLRENSEYLTGELLKEIPKTEARPFNLTFYRESKTERILCLVRGDSEWIIDRVYSRESEISRLVRRIELEDLCDTELVGKTTVNMEMFQSFVKAAENGPLAKLHELSLMLLKNIEILGTLVYASPFIAEIGRLSKVLHDTGMGNLLLCDDIAKKDAFLRHMKIEFEQVTCENIDNQALNTESDGRIQAKVIQGQTIMKLKQQNKFDKLVKILKGNHYTILVKYNNDQLKELLKLLKDNEIATAGIAENESLLPLLKYTDVGIAFGSPTSCPDLHRYSDISLQDTGHFLKLLLVHSRNNYLGTSKLLLFLLQKSLMLFFCQLLYSFYSLCTDITLMPVLYHYLLECLLLTVPPFFFYLFQGDFSYKTMVSNSHLMKVCSEGRLWGWRQVLLRALTVGVQSAGIVFVVVYSLADPVDAMGTMKGHEIAGFLVYFCVFHACIWKMSISGEQITWQQTLITSASVLLFYGISSLLTSASIAPSIDLSISNVMPSAFSGRGFVIGAVVVFEVGLIDFMLMLRDRVFSKVHLVRPVAEPHEMKEGSQNQLVVLDLQER